MVRHLLLGSLLLAASALADERLVVTRDIRAGEALTSADVAVKVVPKKLASFVVAADSFSYVQSSVVRYPLKKGDLVLWSAFEQPELVKRCAAVLDKK